MAEIRIRKLIKLFNVGIDTLVDFLNTRGARIESANPNLYSEGTIEEKKQDTFAPINETIQSFPRVMHGLPLKLNKRIFYPSMVNSCHGIAHTSRVLLYSYIICCNLSGVSDDEKNACYLAAIIHDLGKTDDSEGSIHGYKTMIRFKDTVHQIIPSLELQNRILNAVRYHSVEDDECPADTRNDLIWKVLKDSDALDRSRFHRGCDVQYLRLPLFKQQIGELLVEFANSLPAITSNLAWDNPCDELLCVINRVLRSH